MGLDAKAIRSEFRASDPAGIPDIFDGCFDLNAIIGESCCGRFGEGEDGLCAGEEGKRERERERKARGVCKKEGW